MTRRLPEWFRQEILEDGARRMLQLLREQDIDTVCVSSKCPNLTDCFRQSRLTFMILGNTCTRDCLFCAVAKKETSLHPQHSFEDKNGPERIRRVVEALGLKYVVITSVTRDDLPDGGAGEFVNTIKAIRALDADIGIEALVPDFGGNIASLREVISARPCCLAHNLETVKRLHKELKPRSDYGVSLLMLAAAKGSDAALVTKSSLMLGLGETHEEVVEAMRDLRQTGCDVLTLGQYLAPSSLHYPVKEFIDVKRFAVYKDIGLEMGFSAVLSGPKVRSSYMAEQIYPVTPRSGV